MDADIQQPAAFELCPGVGMMPAIRTSTTVKLFPKSCCRAALAFLQKGQYLSNQHTRISKQADQGDKKQVTWQFALKCLRLGEDDHFLAFY